MSGSVLEKDAGEHRDAPCHRPGEMTPLGALRVITCYRASSNLSRAPMLEFLFILKRRSLEGTPDGG